MNKYKKYYGAVSYIEKFSNLSLKHNYMVDKSNPEIFLKRMRYFLNLIGNPDKSLNLIHITGTSGKGTVTNMIHEILFASGEKVGSFTSPFVTTSIEKIKVNDKYISTNEFIKIVNYLKPHIEDTYVNSPYGGISYFEIFLAISLLYFKNKGCNWVVLEVGLGGRYDATNIIENPIITAITNIDYDHIELLGKTLKKIALDKAGIIKKGSKFFTTENRPSILKIFKEVCISKKVSMIHIPYSPDYMENNRALATAITKSLKIENKFILKGLGKAKLQCRFEMMQNKPTVIIDGAHNRAKIKSTIDNLKNLKFNKLYLILSISQDKDHESIIKQIIPFADFFFPTQFKNYFRKSADPKDLLVKSKKYLKKGAKTEYFLYSQQALDKAIKGAKKDDLILVTGSFFLAGEIRKLWYPEDRVLRNRDAFK